MVSTNRNPPGFSRGEVQLNCPYTNPLKKERIYGHFIRVLSRLIGRSG